jgi:hypothetical protein
MNRKDKYDEHVWRGWVTGDYPPGLTVGDFGEPQPIWSNPAFTTPIMQNVQNMTRRDFFAGLAMLGMLSHGSYAYPSDAISHADSILAELDKTK